MLATHQQPGWQYGPVTRMAYGYLWWLSNVGGHAVAFGWGYRGQYVLVARALNLVVVATSALDAPIPPDQEAEDVLDLIVSGVLPAIGG
jgi:hypothetical protein